MHYKQGAYFRGGLTVGRGLTIQTIQYISFADIGYIGRYLILAYTDMPTLVTREEESHLTEVTETTIHFSVTMYTVTTHSLLTRPGFLLHIKSGFLMRCFAFCSSACFYLKEKFGCEKQN